MRKFTFILVMVLLLATGGTGLCQNTGEEQESEYSTTVLLKNGGKVVGKIVESDDEDVVIVERTDGVQIEIPYREIDSINSDGDFESRQAQILDSLKYAPVQRMSPNFLLRLSLIGSFGSVGEGVVGGISASGGFMPSDNLFVGGGAGVDFAESEDTFLPIFGEAHYYFGPLEWAMMLYGRLGWALGWVNNGDRSDYGGLRAELGWGIMKTFASDENAFFFTAGYYRQDVASDHPTWDGAIDGVAGGIGVMF